MTTRQRGPNGRYLCGCRAVVFPAILPVEALEQIKAAEVYGCCPRSYTCPDCGNGAGEAPHNDCQGWNADAIARI